MPQEKNKMDFVILDLEWNGAFSKRLGRFINEIIEIGAVRVDGNMNVLDTFEALVRPQVGKQISGKIRSLTNITNEELEGGLVFMQALSRFGRWAGGAVIMTWGTSDILALIENCRYFCGSGRIPFLHRYADLQAYCESGLKSGSARQPLGLSTAAGILGIDENGYDHHRALEDSLLELRCFQKLYPSESLIPFLQDAENSEFYRRMEFKTVTVCDLHSPLIRPQDLVFRCDVCGHRARRVGEWQLHNKSFHALFFCSRCDRKFYGRVQFKLKYEGLVIRKKILPYPRPKTPAEADMPAAEQTAGQAAPG